jgi:hypothetical protein
VVIGDFYLVCVGAVPSEDDTPLLIDSNGVKTGKISSKCFEAIAGGESEVLERFGFMNGNQLMVSSLLDLPGELSREFEIENLLGLFVPELSGHQENEYSNLSKITRTKIKGHRELGFQGFCPIGLPKESRQWPRRAWP